MSPLGKNLLKKEDAIINVICLVFAVGILALAAMNISWGAGLSGLLTTDTLFFIVVSVLLASVLLISPLLWLHSQGIIKNPFAAGNDAELAVDTTPVHFEGSTKLFLTVLGALLGLTIIEVILAYFQVSILIMLTLLLSLSIIKAALIVAYFMHLRFERLSLVITLVPALVICICLLFVFFPDSFRSSNMRYKFTPAAPEAETTAPAEESH
ncbi:MAG: cytochrome c oxidase subunit [Blastocatellia bacterium]|jgi:cytochrome c oxidase subunit 4|nr:cytochrome c oxidase subunit [Blastocatellia bacterium]